jgi:hypothetical protein
MGWGGYNCQLEEVGGLGGAVACVHCDGDLACSRYVIYVLVVGTLQNCNCDCALFLGGCEGAIWNTSS